MIPTQTLGKVNLSSYGLLVGAFGQYAFLTQLRTRVPGWLIGIAVLLPWMTVFIISLCKRPPFGSRPFRLCLMLAVSWFLLMTVTAESALGLGLIESTFAGLPRLAARVLMYLGFGSFPFIIHTYVCLLRRESAHAGDVASSQNQTAR